VKALVLTLFAVALTQLFIRHERRPTAWLFAEMVENPDCVPFLDEHLLRRI
jgi:hypothetical protein